MPDAFTYPGIYVQEIPSGVHTIAGVSTSSTAFVDCFQRGPLDTAVQVTSWASFVNTFGGLWSPSEGSYAVQQFFVNGGSVAWIVRVAGHGTQAAPATAPAAATVQLKHGVVNNAGGTAVLTVTAASPGLWGNALQVVATASASDATRFNLLVQETTPSAAGPVAVTSQAFTSLSMAPADPNYVVSVVAAGSKLITVADNGDGHTLPDLVTPLDRMGTLPKNSWIALSGGTDGAVPDVPGLLGDQSTTGLYALDRISPAIFNLLCLPVAGKMTLTAAAYTSLVTAVEAFCVTKRAFFIVDPPIGVIDEPGAFSWFASAGIASSNAAVYFPPLQMPDLLQGGAPRIVGASGTIAGIYARTDGARGVWKAPAGVDATIAGATLAANITDLEQGVLNPLGVNVIRNFPLFGSIVWGARTLNGADALASPWKYVPVRRTALYIEESLFQGMRWAVFEPNDEPLWAQIRASVDDFMSELFRSGAFQGSTPDQAYLVKCDGDTTTQSDIDRGIVNVIVGFAPLKPAEFVVLKIQQLAGQSA